MQITVRSLTHVYPVSFEMHCEKDLGPRHIMVGCEREVRLHSGTIVYKRIVKNFPDQEDVVSCSSLPILHFNSALLADLCLYEFALSEDKQTQA